MARKVFSRIKTFGSLNTLSQKRFAPAIRNGHMVRDSYRGDTEWFQLVKETRERDGHKCVNCDSAEKLATHHITPVSKGGRTVKSNLITKCERCHAKRHTHLAMTRR